MSTITSQRGRQSSEELLSDRYYRGSGGRSLRSSYAPPTTTEAEQSLAIPFGDGVFVFEPAPDEWIVPILEDVCTLGSLPPNWNSYGSKAIQPSIAVAAATLLLNVMESDDPAPAIVPTSRGGILLEWHEGGIDLEVDVRSSSWFHVAFADGENEEEYDHADIDIVRKKLDILRCRLK